MKQESLNELKRLKSEGNLLKGDTKIDLKKFYTVEQMVSIFETTRQTIDSWTKAGRFNKIKIGSRSFYNKSEVDEFIEYLKK